MLGVVELHSKVNYFSASLALLTNRLCRQPPFRCETADDS